jgi:hypothetical protein
VEDDHVDRPGVEVRQRMKLTGTNSSIGLIVLVASAHQASLEEHATIFVLTRETLRTGRAIRRDGLASCTAAKLDIEQGNNTGRGPSPSVWRAVCSAAIADRDSVKTKDVFKTQ